MEKYGGYEDNPLLAEFYDLVPMYHNRPDVSFYVNLCKNTKGDILEVGCGTGRILIPAAEAGCRITGLDLSQNMISRCREKIKSLSKEVQDRVRLVEGNATDFNIDRAFSLVTVPFRVFSHMLTVKDQMACLGNANRHLVSGGRLVVDLFQVNFEILSKPSGEEEIEDTPEFELKDGRRLRRTHRVLSVNHSEQVSDVEMIYYLTGVDGKITRTVQGFPFRFFFRYEMEHLLHRCGFEIVDQFGDFDRSSLRDGSPEMIFICEKRRDLE